VSNVDNNDIADVVMEQSIGQDEQANKFSAEVRIRKTQVLLCVIYAMFSISLLFIQQLTGSSSLLINLSCKYFSAVAIINNIILVVPF